MLGQKSVSDYNQYQKEVESYLEENDPYAPLTPLIKPFYGGMKCQDRFCR